MSAQERQLYLAVAVLLHEARRADYAEGDAESAAAEQALAEEVETLLGDPPTLDLAHEPAVVLVVR